MIRSLSTGHSTMAKQGVRAMVIGSAYPPLSSYMLMRLRVICACVCWRIVWISIQSAIVGCKSLLLTLAAAAFFFFFFFFPFVLPVDCGVVAALFVLLRVAFVLLPGVAPPRAVRAVF